MPKSKTRPRKKAPQAAQKIVEAAQEETIIVKKTYGSAFKEILPDPKFMIPLGIISIAVGIAMQVNWVQTKCPGEPFFGSSVTMCKDNMLRLILGGPLVCILTSFLAVWLKRNLTYWENNKILRFFILLLPLLSLPFIQTEPNKNKATAIIMLLFIGSLIYAFRDRIKAFSKSVFAKPVFSVDTSSENDALTITLAGSLLFEEKDWIYESMLDVLTDANRPNTNIRINISDLQGFDQRFSFIFQLFAGLGAYSNQKIALVGPEDLISEINKSLRFRFESSSYGQ